MEQVAVAQEKVRNKGWRIHRIRWKKDGKAEWVHNTPLSLMLVILGLISFLVPIALVLKEAIPEPAALLAVLGIGLLFLSRVLAARAQFRGWIPVDAVCVDRETRKRKRKSQSHSVGYDSNFVERVGILQVVMHQRVPGFVKGSHPLFNGGYEP